MTRKTKSIQCEKMDKRDLAERIVKSWLYDDVMKYAIDVTESWLSGLTEEEIKEQEGIFNGED